MLDATQITIDDAIADVEREQRLADHADGRDVLTLGDHAAWVEQNEGVGWIVLGELNRRDGFCIAILPPFAGAIDDEGTPGIMISATHPELPGVEIKILGRNVDECIPQLLVEIERLALADRRSCGARAATPGDRRRNAENLAGAQ